MKYLFFLATFIHLFPLTNISAQNLKNNEIDKYIKEVQQQYNIPGLALAVIKDGKLIHKMNYGLANIEMGVPVTDKTLFPLFSTTKVMSVIAVYQLIQENKIALESPISYFLDDLPITWKNVQVKNLITHSSGLPDIVNYTTENEENAKQKVYNDSIKFSPGNQFDYNQTNYWLLNRIFQKVVHKTLSQFIIDTQFQSVVRSVVFEGNNLKVVENLSYGYVNTDGSAEFLKRNWNFPEYEYGAAALNMTLDAFIEWNTNFDNGFFISDKMKKQLLAPFNYEIKRDFTYGLDLIKQNNDVSYGFSGGLSTAFRKFPDKGLTVILLANGMFIPTDKRHGINEVVNTIASIAEKK
ncbi:CubicO group peptidase (beta-lactamase class C family) [Flavobacterium cutihirudinis]|uniref:CubicO group peptidase (Beta-lactamase class C family) n=1 Tax=Flavobacterium cutihirudinis TaxID=1265740 RepID=A0A3D9FQ62_9FLAO|nr:serine hydrolase domain-containing protein [Flavobacterium cutihirudinis]RED22501.1 CubicO group peptidase (beta-lactamase class C family) [Flavobacterium cutihirudinis]